MWEMAPCTRRTSQPSPSMSDLLREPPCCRIGCQCPGGTEEGLCSPSNCRQGNRACLRERPGSALGLVTTRSHGSQKVAWIWLVKVPGVKGPGTGLSPEAAAQFSTACSRCSYRINADITWDFHGNNGKNCQQQLLPGSFRLYDVGHCSFRRCTVPFGSEDWCRPRGFLQQKKLRRPSCFIGRTSRASGCGKVSLRVTMGTQNHAVWAGRLENIYLMSVWSQALGPVLGELKMRQTLALPSQTGARPPAVAHALLPCTPVLSLWKCLSVHRTAYVFFPLPMGLHKRMKRARNDKYICK